MKYFFDWNEEERFELAPHYSSVHGSVIKGERLFVALYNKKRGTGARMHRHSNEQFIYVLKGNVKARVEDQEQTVPPGSVIYIPANAAHSMVATGDEDVVYYVSKDMGPIAGIPLDGKDTGPHYEPGFEPRSKGEEK
jgi:quercetin dioxygenase-like cupin family protein